MSIYTEKEIELTMQAFSCTREEAIENHCASVRAHREQLRAEHLRNVYKINRAQEYPPIGDQLDALWKGGEAAAEMLAKVQAVKNKYPKPE